MMVRLPPAAQFLQTRDPGLVSAGADRVGVALGATRRLRRTEEWHTHVV